MISLAGIIVESACSGLIAFHCPGRDGQGGLWLRENGVLQGQIKCSFCPGMADLGESKCWHHLGLGPGWVLLVLLHNHSSTLGHFGRLGEAESVV